MLLSTMVCLVSNIWRAKAATYGSFMGACALSGVGAKVSGSLWNHHDPKLTLPDFDTCHHHRCDVFA
jgi:hypothetical protein